MDFVEQLKSSIDIVKVVGEYVRLRRIGATGRYLGLCPFHQEKTPSFNVNQTRQFYKCFGCGAGGDALKFVMEVEGFTFPETLKMLAERNGIPMPQRSEYSDSDSRLRGALQEMHAIAASLYKNLLHGPQGRDAQAYLTKRGLNEELVETFELGLSDPNGQALTRKLTEEGFKPEQMEVSGLVRRRDGGGLYDAFRGRLMFPIHNESGKVIAFGGRTMKADEQPKYLNSPETPLYKKTSTLYNLHRARNAMRKENRAILVEGYMGAIQVHGAGVHEVVARCGTALTNAQVRAMHRHADTVFVDVDADPAGRSAGESAIQLLLDEELHVRMPPLLDTEDGLDPDDYIRQKGAPAYQTRLATFIPYHLWLADRARKKFDTRTSDGKMDAFKSVVSRVRSKNKLEEAVVANDLADYLGVDRSLVLNQFRRSHTGAAAAPSATAARPTKIAIPVLERILINALISSEETRRQILPQLPESMTAGFVTRGIFQAIRNESLSDNPVTFGALDARLQEGDRTLLHDISAADEIEDDAAYLEQAQACVRRLADDFRKHQLNDLRAQVKAAEREGRMEDALQLMRGLDALKK